MIRNYFRIAYRNLMKNRVFTLVNILGLAIGITACLFISMYVNYQKSYDSFYKDSNTIYRVRWERHSEKGDEIRFASACPAVGDALIESFPEIEACAHAYNATGIYSYKEQVFQEEKAFWADNEYLKMFSFDFMKGNSDQALLAENSVVISESVAKKYFKDEDPMGKFLSMNKELKLEVKGVFKDRPKNVHCSTDILISYSTLAKLYGPQVMKSWLYSGFYTYVRLKDGTDPKQVESKIPPLLKDRIADVLKKYQLEMFFYLQPIEDIHLTSHYMQELEANGDIKTVNFLDIIAYFIILIAWVNFLNLSTISYIGRAKEVGLRKVVGASRSKIVLQFLMEAIFINLLAVCLSMIFLELFTPLFKSLSGIPESYKIWQHAWLYTSLFGMLFIGIFLSGMYPVWGLSFTDMNKMLKGEYKGSRSGLMLRKGLVLLQFVISIVLIAGTLSVMGQLNFMRKADPGFNKEDVIVLGTPMVGDSTLLSKRDVFRMELMRQPNIHTVAYSSYVPGEAIKSNLGSIYKEGDEPTSSKNYRLIQVNEEFLDLYEMKMLKGRNFSKEFVSDAKTVVINAKAAHHLGFDHPEDAVGKNIFLHKAKRKVIGVIKNYAHRSPKEEFEPIIFHTRPGLLGYLSVKLNGGLTNETIRDIEKSYQEMFAGNPFDYYVLKESYEAQYGDDERFGKVFGIFALLGIIITSLGLLSLSAFSANQRRKEIGVRKVMGASVQGLLLMLSKDYLKLLILATVLMFPLFYYALDTWLESFAYKMEISLYLFVVPVFLVGFIALLTISYQSYKTANLNPIKSIKYE
ncbi:FtsX-like permease family protein [Marinifilum sp. N1E240]|uniref:ABC transporter permease n=1 Tax=Marinifilum sp. N1E240 TaxID=2608082 RepID=UPI00128CB34C|nr:ABC transporter permease [Marinifilum sp. N1E240]MPQ46140.1 FtsX-like permease family protein [Marinifilum sp. N1E240]